MASPMYHRSPEICASRSSRACSNPASSCGPNSSCKSTTELRGTQSGTRSSGSPPSDSWDTRPGHRAPSSSRRSIRLSPLCRPIPRPGLGGGEGATYLSQVSKQHREASYSAPQVAIQKASSEVSAGLQVPEGTQVISRSQRRYVDRTPWSLQTSFYPRGFVAQGADRLIEADDIEMGTVKYLAQTLGLQQVAYRDWIKVRAPDTSEATFFNLSQDGRVGVFEIIRTAFDQTGRPMRLTVTIFPTDRNEFVVNVGEVSPL